MNLLVATIIAIIVIAVGAAIIFLSPSNSTIVPLPSPDAISSSNSANTDKGIAIVASGLEVPWGIDISEDGRIFFTERPGRVRVIDQGKLIKEPVANIRVEQNGEAGLLGLALHPNFTQNHLIYIYHSYPNKGNTYNKVVALTEKDNKAIDSQIVIDNIPGAAFHDGGRIKFGPDEKLYIATGDAMSGELAQNAKSLAGKILRINADGTIPQDNPFPGSPVYSYGHRNIQGLAWDPVTKELYATEHGSEGNDEINIIKPGKNYGWPIEDCSNAAKFERPVICFNPGIAPAGIIFSNSDRLGYKNDLIITTLNGKHLRLIDLESDIQSNILVGFGRLRDIIEDSEGTLYILTSNRDGRGIAEADDDKILRILKA